MSEPETQATSAGQEISGPQASPFWQLPSAKHCTQRSLVLQYGVFPPHCVFEVHSTHWCEFVSHTRPLVQLVSARHCTQNPIWVSQ